MWWCCLFVIMIHLRIAKELTRSPDAVFLMLPQNEMSGLMAGSRALDMKMHDGSSRPLENAKVMLKCMDVNLKCTPVVMFGKYAKMSPSRVFQSR